MMLFMDTISGGMTCSLSIAWYVVGGEWSPRHPRACSLRLSNLVLGGRDVVYFFFFFQAEDGIRDVAVTGVQTCALPISPDMVAAGPDGSVYIASQDYRIYQLIPGQGGVSVFAGNGQYGDSGDGGLAINAQLTTPYGVAVAPDGSVYIAEPYSDRIRKVDPSGIITTFAGTGAEGYSGDGGPANAALLNRPFGVAVGPDGSVYVADSNNNVIRRIGPDGIITTVAGTGTYSFSGDGGLATQATLRSPQDVAVARDGTIYIADTFSRCVRRVGVDGIIASVTQCTFSIFPQYLGDGGLAVNAVTDAAAVAVGPDNSLYVAGQSPGVHLEVRGIVNTVAGNGTSGYSGDGGPATQAQLSNPRGITVSPDGSIYEADNGSFRTRRAAAPLPGLGLSTFVLAAEDGSELYTFNNVGKHLSTVDALTGAVKYQFSYDSNGLLASVTDVAGNVTTIERDGAGNPTAIVAPGWQRTTLTVEEIGRAHV